MKNKKIAIISGENPKPLLKKELSARGAIISSIVCYRRKVINYNMAVIFPQLAQAKINTVICTSHEMFLQLINLLKDPAHFAWLLNKKLCVINPKMKADALALGFTSVVLADNATDEAIVVAISGTAHAENW